MLEHLVPVDYSSGMLSAYIPFKAGLTSTEILWGFWKISMGELEILKLIKL